MVDEINYDAEWAYWIDIKVFILHRLKKAIPIGSLVLTKTRGVSEQGIKYVETDYGIAKEDGVKDISKREASKILVERAVEYMKQNKRWPPNMTIKDSFKDGDVEIVFAPSEYDIFNLKFTSELVGQKPLDFLESLKPSAKEAEPAWMIEIAKSGRSKCRVCGQQIEEGRFRIGESYLYEEHLSYRWHHPKCIASTLYTPLEKLDGFRLLSPDEKIRLRKLLQK
ncbi:MAG: PARP-type zinc finger-containing protein [Candidatus Thorarchaeota archaeon]